jgi:SAM-dependent methyltransferase
MTDPRYRCTTDKYDTLYSRYLEDPGRLLEVAHWEPGMALLDLCGGTGAVSLEAMRRGGFPDDIILADLNPRCPDTQIRQLRGNLNQLASTLEATPEQGPRRPVDLRGIFDVVVCRQAMAYLDLDTEWFRSLATYMKPGGVFVFNVFRWPRRASRWVWKSYFWKDRKFYEAGFCGKEYVYHLQASPGLGFDVTKFRGYSTAELAAWVSKAGFEAGFSRKGNTIDWRCTKL